MRKFSEEEIAFMRTLRAQGLAYQQIADQMPIKFKRFGGKAPSKSAVRKHTEDVKVLAEGEELPEVEVDFPEEDTDEKEENVQELMEIIKRLNDFDSPAEIAVEHNPYLVLKGMELHKKLTGDDVENARFLLKEDLQSGESILDGITRIQVERDALKKEVKRLAAANVELEKEHDELVEFYEKQIMQLEKELEKKKRDLRFR